MNARWLGVGLILFTLAVVQACGNPGTRCTTSSDCSNQGVCQGGFCTDQSGLGQGADAARSVDRDDGGLPDAGVTDAGQDADAGLDNGRG